MPKKPSSMKKTGKAKAKPLTPKQKAAKAAKKLGTGYASKAASDITKNAARRRKMLKEMG